MIDERLRALDGVTPPDQWTEITERAASGDSVALAGGADHRPRRLLLAAAIVVVLAGVAGGLALARHDDGRSPTADPVDPDEEIIDRVPAEIWGRTWALQRLRQDRVDVEIPVVEADPSVGELDLTEIGVVGFHGCNSGGLRAHFDTDRLVADSGWESEGRACDEPLMRLDEVVAELFQSDPAIEIRGSDLVLRSATITAELVETGAAVELEIVEPEDPTALWGVIWELDQLLDGGEPVPLPPSGTGTDGVRPAGSPFFLDATERGRLSFTGCNAAGSPAALDGDRLIRTGMFGSTLARCADPLMHLDLFMADLLEAEPTVVVGGGHLVLRAGDLVASFQDPTA